MASRLHRRRKTRTSEMVPARALLLAASAARREVDFGAGSVATSVSPGSRICEALVAMVAASFSRRRERREEVWLWKRVRR